MVGVCVPLQPANRVANRRVNRIKMKVVFFMACPRLVGVSSLVEGGVFSIGGILPVIKKMSLNAGLQAIPRCDAHL